MELSASVSVLTFLLLAANSALSIRFPDRISQDPIDSPDDPLKTAVFALGSFWRSEAAFGCLHGVGRTTAGYAGGSKPNPEYRSLGDHAECVQMAVNLNNGIQWKIMRFFSSHLNYEPDHYVHLSPEN